MSAVIGLDLSLTSTGVAVAEDGELVFTRAIKTKGSKKDTLADRQRRLAHIRETIFADIIDGEDTDLAVIESPSFGSSFGSAHDRSGLWWQIVDGLFVREIPVAQVSPQGRAKYIAGSGRSGKDVVLAHAIERWCGGAINFRTDDEADATGLCSMGARRLGEPIEESMPEQNLEAMDGVLWPL